MATATLLHWSGGKDAALALHRLQTSLLNGTEYTVTGLLTTISTLTTRVVMHGLRRELLQAQTSAIGIDLLEVPLPPAPGHEAYEAAIGAAYESLRASGTSTIAFGDIFLEDLRAYRDAQLAGLGLTGIYPLWKGATRSLVRELVETGIHATVICVDASRLDRSFLGRTVDEAFLADLPAGVDPCGENGEFHTFVWDAPYFKAPVRFQQGETVHRSYTGEKARAGEGFYFLDLLPG